MRFGRRAPRQDHDYREDYGGPRATWPAEEPDWATLFPVPARAPAQHEDEDEYEDEYDDFWLTPRMACKLYIAACLYHDELRDVLCTSDFRYEELPEVVHEYTSKPLWQEAYEMCVMRLASRLAKGMEPQPNCTGEEMALHKIIEMARYDDFEAFDDELEALPSHPKDDDFDMVSDIAFLDHDVLMLYDLGQSLLDNIGLQQYMDMAHLHPHEWFLPFKDYRVDDHVLPPKPAPAAAPGGAPAAADIKEEAAVPSPPPTKKRSSSGNKATAAAGRKRSASGSVGDKPAEKRQTRASAGGVGDKPAEKRQARASAGGVGDNPAKKTRASAGGGGKKPKSRKATK